MISNRQFEQMKRCRAELKRALTAEMEKRKGREFDAWVLAEREAITLAANRWIVAHTEFPTLTLKQVEEVENLAVGHSNYGDKFVLYVSELAYGLRGTP